MKTNRIKKQFSKVLKAEQKAFIAYITAGDPSLDKTVERVCCLAEAGADIIELGVPFSDPLADGRVNQEAANRALEAGATLPRVIECVKEIRARTDIPIVFFSYLNPFLAGGFEKTVQQAAAAGVDGLLLLDLPVEESAAYRKMIRRSGMDMINLITPTSSDERIKRIAAVSSGFIYCVSRAGVTGAQETLAGSARDLVERIRKTSELPIALGFGISTPEQAAQAAAYADGIIVGSAIVDRFLQAESKPDGYKDVQDWVRSLVCAAKGI